ncbi:MAG TPA: hypothetical protein VIV60_20870, partial [Polyangiaceae bacterium]
MTASRYARAILCSSVLHAAVLAQLVHKGAQAPLRTTSDVEHIEPLGGADASARTSETLLPVQLESAGLDVPNTAPTEVTQGVSKAIESTRHKAPEHKSETRRPAAPPVAV